MPSNQGSPSPRESVQGAMRLLKECKEVMNFYGSAGNYGFTDDDGCVWPDRVGKDRGQLAAAMWRKLDKAGVPDAE